MEKRRLLTVIMLYVSAAVLFGIGLGRVFATWESDAQSLATLFLALGVLLGARHLRKLWRLW